MATSKQQKAQIAFWVVLLVCLFPLILWLFVPQAEHKFTKSILLVNLGQMSALVGICMMSANFVLSTRLKFLDRYFNGLNMVYLRHSQLGQIAFILLLFHPLLLLPKYASTAHQAVRFLLPVNGFAQNLGWFGLVTMVILIVLTLYLRPRYDTWKSLHKFMGLALLLGGLHSQLVPNDLTLFSPLRVYILTVTVLGLAAFTYHTMLGAKLAQKYMYKVVKTAKLAPDIIEITLAPVGSGPKFAPGQFVFISFINSSVGNESHPFSLTKIANQTISLAIKQDGDYVTKLTNLQAGDKLTLEGPFGAFNYIDSTYKTQIWIAGGIGITPFVSLAATLRDHPDYTVTLVYAVKNRTQAVYAKLLESIPNLTIYYHFSQTQGRTDITKIGERIGGLAHKEILLCAPPAMIGILKSQLSALGIDAKLIHSEEFSLDQQ